MSITHRQKTMPFTQLQGQYLAFIYAYSKINRRAPAESDLQRYFGTTAPTVHRMVCALENAHFITRETGKPRSIRLLVDPENLPVLR